MRYTLSIAFVAMLFIATSTEARKEKTTTCDCDCAGWNYLGPTTDNTLTRQCQTATEVVTQFKHPGDPDPSCVDFSFGDQTCFCAMKPQYGMFAIRCYKNMNWSDWVYFVNPETQPDLCSWM